MKGKKDDVAIQTWWIWVLKRKRQRETEERAGVICVWWIVYLEMHASKMRVYKANSSILMNN